MNLIQDVLFFLQSPINILSGKCFAKQLNDLTGTGIDTKQLQSCFFWDSENYSLAIHHRSSNLLEFFINEGFTLSTIFRVIVLRVINTSNHLKYDCCYTKMNEDNKDCSNCQSAFTLSKDVIRTELFDMGETIFNTNDGRSGLVKVK